MSHTDKDRPYWVKLNDDGVLTDHYHQSFGREIYVNRTVKDERGRPVYEEAPRTMSASMIDLRASGISRYVVEQLSEEITAKARNYCALGHPYAQIEVGTKSVPVTESVLMVTMRDYCTEGEKYRAGLSQYSDLPCHPAMLPGSWGSIYMSFSATKAKRTYSKMRNGASRRRSRDYLRSAVDEFNTYGEAFDNDDELPLTGQHRHSMLWDVW